MMLLRRTLASLVVVLAVLGASTSAAHAQTWSHTDPAGDVSVVINSRAQLAPNQRTPDIRRVVARHTSTQVVVRFGLRSSMPRGTWMVAIGVWTGAHPYSIYLWGKGNVRTGVRLEEDGPGGRGAIACRGMRVNIDRTGTSVAAIVPRTCLGQPRRVRVSVWVDALIRGRSYVDDGLRRGDGELTRTPWIRRG
ncbi:MAG TPA: hypothetical protein VM575_09615 [Nocardioides sp.]|jgi:hypothetical protein|nr:hypothetical protein [Nocardioides sp.]